MNLIMINFVIFLFIATLSSKIHTHLLKFNILIIQKMKMSQHRQADQSRNCNRCSTHKVRNWFKIKIRLKLFITLTLTARCVPDLRAAS